MIKNKFFSIIKKKVSAILNHKKSSDIWQGKMKDEIEKMGRFNSQLILMMK